MQVKADYAIKMVLEGLLGIAGIVMFVILTAWLFYFIQGMRKSFKAWKVHRSSSHDEERRYALRAELAKSILIVLFLTTSFILLSIFAVQNASRLTTEDRYKHKVEKHGDEKCKIEERSWIWDKVHENKHISWLQHGQWQPFALIALISFEMILVQILTSQYNNSRRLFTWQVKVTSILGLIEFLCVFLLNAFPITIMFGHTLFIFLLCLHLILTDLCLIKLYGIMKLQIKELAHLKTKEYFEYIRSETRHKLFIIPQILIIHGCVLVELLHITAILVETVIVNRCWIEKTYNLKYPIEIGETKDMSPYFYSRYGIGLMRIALMFALIIYNVIFNGIYCYKSWQNKQERKLSGSYTMQNSDEIERPLISGEDSSNKE